MIVACSCRSFSRVDCIWKVANATLILSKPIHYFQGSLLSHNLNASWKMGGTMDGLNAMDSHKKQRTVTPVWRPFSAQSSPIEEVREEKGLTFSANVTERKLHENQCSTSDPKSGEVIYREQVEEVSLHELDIQMNVQSANITERHSTSVEVDASLIRFIKGKGGCTQRQIQEDTGVKINFPLSKEETSVVIEGSSIESVTEASEKIQALLEEAVKSPSLDYSHFISLPLALHPELVEKLTNFQNSILGFPGSGKGNLDSDSNEVTSDDEDKDNHLDGALNVVVNLKVQDDIEQVKVEINDTSGKSDASKVPRHSDISDLGIDKSIFIKPRTFHLTVLMLKLWNKERISRATEVLQKVSSKVKDALDNRPISVRLKGLECMKGSPAKARVLYAPVEEIGGEDRLFRACQVIIDAYVEAGLVLEKDTQHKLKLHATLMNARHRKRKERTRRFDSFDARQIFKRYGSEEWGDYLIREAHLSQRFAFDDNGYYHCCSSVAFPETMLTE